MISGLTTLLARAFALARSFSYSIEGGGGARVSGRAVFLPERFFVARVRRVVRGF